MITIYKTKSCAYCPMVMKFLDKKGIKYDTVDVTDDMKTRQMVITNSGAMTVPVTVKGDWEAFVVGWQPVKLNELVE